MKKRIFSLALALAFCLGLCPAGLAEETGEDASPQPRAAPADINMAYTGFVFAQGVPIVIRQNGSITSIYDTEGNLLSGETDAGTCRIYGGWFDGDNTHTSSTSIVMESGTAVEIYGGSFKGTLEGNTNIVLNGGTVGWVFGGGSQSNVTGTASVTINSEAQVWGQKLSDSAAERGAVYGGGYAGTVSNTEVIFNGGDAGYIYGGGNGGCTCNNTHVRFMGQPDDYMFVFGGGYGGSVTNAVMEFHGKGYSSANQGIYIYGGGWGDRVDHIEFIIGSNSDPGSTSFDAICENSGSTVSSASFELHVSAANLTMMNSSGLNGTGVTGKVSATIYGDSSTDAIFGTALTEIDELIVESGSFELFSPMDLDRLEVKESGVAVIPAVGGTTALGTLAGSGTVLFSKSTNAETTLPVTVNSIEVPEGSRIKVGSIGGYLSQNWADTVVFQGPGVEALSSASCFSSRNDGYYLAKTDDGNGIQVKEGTEQKRTVIDPTPTFDKPSYQYGETMHITMGLKAEGQAVAGQLLEVRGGVSGVQTFAAAETGADGQVSFDLPVDDNIWASREQGLQAMFHGTQEYTESAYGISLKDGSGAMGYIVTGAQITLEGTIAAPVRGETPVKALSVSESSICTAEVIWSPADAAFRPEVAYTASIRLVPKPGYSLDDGKLAGVTCQGQPLTLPGGTEADGSVMISNVKTFAPIPAIHVTGVTLDQTALSLKEGETARLTAVITPADSDNRAVTWTSSNPAVATVDSRGNVIAVSEGTATITVITADGGKTAGCTVTVTAQSAPPPETETRLEITEGITEVPEGLKDIPELSTPDKLDAAMRTAITQTGVPSKNTAVYDVTLMVSTNRGLTWVPATADNFPSGGLTVTLPYPEGTDSSYEFTVVHMFTTSDFNRTPGDTESPAVTNTDGGLQFTVTGLSPISVGWKEKQTEPVRPSGGGGDSVSSYTVTVERTVHGKVSSNCTRASSGSTVTLTVSPDTGYVLDTLTVTDSRGNEISLTVRENGKYTFTMPGRAVTVKAAFAPLPDGTACDGGADCPSRSFADLEGTQAWYHEAVDFVLQNGLMSGYGGGMFGPDDILTRAQFAQILYNREGRPAVTDGSAFTDVTNSAWYSDAINWAAVNSIVSGCGGGKFGPDDNISREQLAVMLWRYAGSPADTGEELNFNDADKASGYALEALRWAVENGILNGYGDGRLGPEGLVTRAQAAQILKNFNKWSNFRPAEAEAEKRPPAGGSARRRSRR